MAWQCFVYLFNWKCASLGKIQMKRLHKRRPIDWSVNQTWTSNMEADPYAFPGDDYEESETPKFNDSFMELFGESSSEEEFEGFTKEDKRFGIRSRVRDFHHRRDEER